MQSFSKKDRGKVRLIKHHLPIGLLSVGLLLSINAIMQSDNPTFRLSMATGYVALLLLCITLIIGPWKLLRGKKSPRSSDLRRDLGIWSAIMGLAHVFFGIQVHMGNPMLYFFEKGPYPERLVLRSDLFGFANYTGLTATLILLLLLGLSNDVSMRKLGGKRWKSLQRWNYLLAALVVVHGIAFQYIEKRIFIYIALFSLMTAVVIFFQGLGFTNWRRHGG